MINDLPDRPKFLCRISGCTLNATIVGSWLKYNSRVFGEKEAYCQTHAEHCIQKNWLTDPEPLIDYLKTQFNEETWTR